jgi:hypothetical protein
VSPQVLCEFAEVNEYTQKCHSDHTLTVPTVESEGNRLLTWGKFGNRFSGETAEIELLRDGKIVKVQTTLKTPVRLVCSNSLNLLLHRTWVNSQHWCNWMCHHPLFQIQNTVIYTLGEILQFVLQAQRIIVYWWERELLCCFAGASAHWRETAIIPDCGRACFYICLSSLSGVCKLTISVHLRF